MAYPNFRPLFVSIFIIWLAGCSTLQRQNDADIPVNTSEREQQLAAMQQFSLQASIGVKTPAESISGNLRWQQQNNTAYSARLSNFIGISLFELTQDSSGSEILLKGERYRAVDTSTLLLQLSGWSMPLQDMPLWLRGLPGSNGRDVQRDELGRIVSFNLTDSTGIIWQLEYQRFFSDNLALPKRILLSSSDSQITVVIRSWQ